MDYSMLEGLSTGELGLVSLVALVFGFISLLISAFILQLATHWSAHFKPKFWPAVLWVLVAGIAGVVLELVLAVNPWVGMIIGFVVSAIIFKWLIKAREAQRVNWGQAFIIALVYNIAWLVIGLVIGLTSVLIVGAVA